MRAYAILTIIAILSCDAANAVKPSGLPLPRFASLRSGNINVRVGPGTKYPLEWVFTNKSAPVEIIAEFDTWRKIRDHEGNEGWVHHGMLSGVRTALILGTRQTVYSKSDQNAKPVAYIDTGAIARVLKCQGNWCQIQAQAGEQTIKGWLVRDKLFGIYPNEEFKK